MEQAKGIKESEGDHWNKVMVKELPGKETFEQRSLPFMYITVEIAKQRELQVQLLKQEFALVFLKTSKKAKANEAE